jgi:hypothetical protein
MRLVEADINVSENNDSKQQRASTTGQGITRILASNEKILKEQRSVSRHTPVLDLFKSSAGFVHRHLRYSTLEMMIQMTSYHPRTMNATKICLS